MGYKCQLCEKETCYGCSAYENISPAEYYRREGYDEGYDKGYEEGYKRATKKENRKDMG